jgi:hypothetical protein
MQHDQECADAFAGGYLSLTVINHDKVAPFFSESSVCCCHMVDVDAAMSQ